MLRFACPHCQKRLKVAEEHSGRRVNCPRCGKSLVVPDSERTRTPLPLRPSEMLAAEGPAASPGGAPVDEDAAPAINFRAAVSTDEDLDLTPMVDVTFQLLIFFMLTMAAGLTKSIEVPTPDPSQQAAQSRSLSELEEDDDYVVVQIDDDNTIWVDGREATRMEVVPRLRELRDAAGANPPSNLLVLASGEARHETVVSVLDAGSEAGMSQVRLGALDETE
ncbi:MAG: biopolymer transporter ExbD [Pirellulales bacterium]|nr:biopolymer transporter ExbD [Pirellulales bacterium]